MPPTPVHVVPPGFDDTPPSFGAFALNFNDRCLAAGTESANEEDACLVIWWLLTPQPWLSCHHSWRWSYRDARQENPLGTYSESFAASISKVWLHLFPSLLFLIDVIIIFCLTPFAGPLSSLQILSGSDGQRGWAHRPLWPPCFMWGRRSVGHLQCGVQRSEYSLHKFLAMGWVHLSECILQNALGWCGTDASRLFCCSDFLHLHRWTAEEPFNDLPVWQASGSEVRWTPLPWYGSLPWIHPNSFSAGPSSALFAGLPQSANHGPWLCSRRLQKVRGWPLNLDLVLLKAAFPTSAFQWWSAHPGSDWWSQDCSADRWSFIHSPGICMGLHGANCPPAVHCRICCCMIYMIISIVFQAGVLFTGCEEGRLCLWAAQGEDAEAEKVKGEKVKGKPVKPKEGSKNQHKVSETTVWFSTANPLFTHIYHLFNCEEEWKLQKIIMWHWIRIAKRGRS